MRRTEVAGSWIFGVCLLLLAAVPGLQAAESWKAGVSRIDITPSEPTWMAGYASRTKPSEGVRQRLYAKALALEDSAGIVSVLLTADLAGFRRDVSQLIVARVTAKYRLPRERLVLNSSHTHSGPVTTVGRYSTYPMNDEHKAAVLRYQAQLVDKVVEVIGAALESREPATLSYEQGFAGFAVNRRRVGHREYPGPTDHDVPVLAVKKADGALLAIAFGYACHATVLSDYQINADWPGYAQEAVETRHPGAVAMFVNGCGADQNPLPRRLVELAQRYGDTISIAVEEVLKGKMRTLGGPLRALYEETPLPFRVPTKAELTGRLNNENVRVREHAERLLAILDKGGELMKEYPYPVQVWQFGKDLTFIALGGEVVVDYSLRFKKTYGWEDTWVSGYNNDVFSYVPSLRVLNEGGYEGGGAMLFGTLPGPFRATVEETIAEKVDEFVKRTGGAK
ncbi:MAG TPA: neutral/alkaline non-lysosomal ceramidase N-terminal domain-containing protein [Bryobacterales bacterium]|nr:neutral/alkaline non-lysosomal ceramidase N-terminal domain-containing protein [Bryobacterales bacterium]